MYILLDFESILLYYKKQAYINNEKMDQRLYSFRQTFYVQSKPTAFLVLTNIYTVIYQQHDRGESTDRHKFYSEFNIKLLWCKIIPGNPPVAPQ